MRLEKVISPVESVKTPETDAPPSSPPPSGSGRVISLSDLKKK
jgi:hypothetical protein